MNQRIKNNWWIDVFLFIGCLLCFYLNLTGVILHQWLGLIVMILAGIHLALHWDWVKAVTRKMFTGANSRNRSYYLLDFLIMIGAVVIFETGLFISTWVDFPLENYSSWRDVHVYASIATLGLTVLKLGLHWRWVANTTGKIFGTRKIARPQPVLVPVETIIPIDRKAIDRRQFLATMGLVGLGSMLAVSEVFSKGDVALAESANTGTHTDGNVTKAVVQANPETGESSTYSSSLNTDEAGIVSSTPTATQTATSMAIPPTSSACTVRCPNGCSFPGRCRKYADQNGNGKCDYGECL